MKTFASTLKNDREVPASADNDVDDMDMMKDVVAPDQVNVDMSSPESSPRESKEKSAPSKSSNINKSEPNVDLLKAAIDEARARNDYLQTYEYDLHREVLEPLLEIAYYNRNTEGFNSTSKAKAAK